MYEDLYTCGQVRNSTLYSHLSLNLLKEGVRTISSCHNCDARGEKAALQVMPWHSQATFHSKMDLPDKNKQRESIVETSTSNQTIDSRPEVGIVPLPGLEIAAWLSQLR